MNPLSLLTKGHTFRGWKERSGLYKLPDKRVLPDFSNPKRQTPTTPHPEPEHRQPAPFKHPQPAAQPPQAASPAPAPAPAPISSPAPVECPPSKPGLWSSKLLLRSFRPGERQPSNHGLWRRVARIPGVWFRRWFSRRTTAPFGSPSVQTELALDKVTVIRNDLSEDDLEVVEAGKKTKTGNPAHTGTIEREKQTADP